MPDKIETGPPPSLYTVVKWALDLFVQGEGGLTNSDEAQQLLCPQKQMIRNTPHFLVFFSIIDISLKITAINRCQQCIYFLYTCQLHIKN